MSTEAPHQGVGILIVDDDEAICETMSAFLEKVGFTTATAGDGQDALETLARTPVQVVITDIVMPGIDGLELTQRMSADHDVDILVMTGFRENCSYEEAIEKGATDFVFKPVRFEELLLRVRRILKARDRRSRRNSMVSRLQTLAITDELTQLFNARHFHQQLKTEIGRAKRYRRPLSLVLLDIDHFKWFNDSFGHLEGDKVLSRVGQIIQGCLRSMDSAYRYGGEEFTLILPETTSDDAGNVAQRIRSTVAGEPFNPAPDNAVSMTVSAGLTEYVPGETPETLVQRSDKAMYVAKESGRNRVTVLSGLPPA